MFVNCNNKSIMAPIVMNASNGIAENGRFSSTQIPERFKFVTENNANFAWKLSQLNLNICTVQSPIFMLFFTYHNHNKIQSKLNNFVCSANKIDKMIGDPL
ncbi:hypothetical protein HA402_004593 [Bradysia odoriphaga]|nr:hypothetical protein HA402_004593 [Bradysia odoriphaga]